MLLVLVLYAYYLVLLCVWKYLGFNYLIKYILTEEVVCNDPRSVNNLVTIYLDHCGNKSKLNAINNRVYLSKRIYQAFGLIKKDIFLSFFLVGNVNFAIRTSFGAIIVGGLAVWEQEKILGMTTNYVYLICWAWLFVLAVRICKNKSICFLYYQFR